MDILAIGEDKTHYLVMQFKRDGANDAFVGQAPRYLGERHFHSFDLEAVGVSEIDDGWAGHKSKKAQAVYELTERIVLPQYSSE